MKFILLLAGSLSFSNFLSAQNCTLETFSENNKYSDWTLSQGAQVRDYNNPLNNCIEERGIQTPGVGGNNPCNIKTPAYTSFGSTSVKISFNIFCFDANMRCQSWKDFGCTTSVDVFYYVGAVKYTGIIDYVLPQNGPGGVTQINMTVPVGNNLPQGTLYQIELCFKPKSGIGNCVQQNTKYIIDNFQKCEAGGQQRISMNTTGVKKSEILQEVIISPNPSNGTDRINISNLPKNSQMDLLDNSGRIIRSFNSNNSRTLHIDGMQKGIYFIRIFNLLTTDLIIKKVVID